MTFIPPTQTTGSSEKAVMRGQKGKKKCLKFSQREIFAVIFLVEGFKAVDLERFTGIAFHDPDAGKVFLDQIGYAGIAFLDAF